jgi:hypothetical protein
MPHVWVLYETGGLSAELFRADTIDYLRSTDQQVDARTGAEQVTLLHVSGRASLPKTFGLDLLKTLAKVRAEGPAEDTVIVPTLNGETWTWEARSLLS